MQQDIKARLDRDLTGSFGSNKYGKEELIAEMSACMLSAKFGFVDNTIDCTASYINNWLKAIKEDVSLSVSVRTASSEGV